MKQEEYEVGKFYWFDNSQKGSGIVKCSKRIDEFVSISEGYNEAGFKIIHKNVYNGLIKGLATPTQIETCLKAYAEKNGYVEGACVKSIDSGEKYILSEIDEWGYNTMLGYFWLRGVRIYKDGKWAEIVKHAPSVQDKQDEALTNSIHEYLTNQDLEKMSVLINGHSVSLLKCVEVYQLCLGIKTVIG